MDATQANVVMPRIPVADTSATYDGMSTRAMILEMQHIMKKLYDAYVECQAQLEQNAAQLQVRAFEKANDAKDARMHAEMISGAIGIFSGIVGLGVGGAGGYLGAKNTNVGFAMGLDMGSHFSTPATSIVNNSGQMGAAGMRSKAEEHQIHSDLARNVVDSAQRDASKVRDNADQHRQQYLQDASQLTQEAIAVLKSTIGPR
jgi:hypothetical protein